MILTYGKSYSAKEVQTRAALCLQFELIVFFWNRLGPVDAAKFFSRIYHEHAVFHVSLAAASEIRAFPVSQSFAIKQDLL